MTFGQDGKPFYINGPRDDTHAIMAKLRQTVGEGISATSSSSRAPVANRARDQDWPRPSRSQGQKE